MNGASLVEETKVFWPRVLYTSVNYNGFEGSKFESYVGTDVLKKKTQQQQQKGAQPTNQQQGPWFKGSWNCSKLALSESHFSGNRGRT